MKLRLYLFLCAGALASAPAAVLPLSQKDAPEKWPRKSNVTLSRGTDGALEMTVRPGEFAYGWFQRALAAEDLPARPAGLYGRYRAPAGCSATLAATLILRRDASSLYFTAQQGALPAQEGWAEFYVPLRDFRPEGGAAAAAHTPERLRAGDTLQLSLSGLSGAPVTVTFDRLRLLGPEESATVGRAVTRATLARTLLPEAACAGAAHPRLLLTPDRVARVRARVAAGGEAAAVFSNLLAHADRLLQSHPADRPFEAVERFEAPEGLTPHQRRGMLEGRVTAAVVPIEILAAVYRLTGDARYGRHAARALVAAARTADADHPALNSGFYYTRTFYVRALAFGYDWLWPLLTPDERREVKTTLLGFALRIHADSWTATWGRRPLHRVWNWDPGLVSSAGLAVLALEGETTAPEPALLFDLRRHLRDYLTLGLDADGCGHEGPAYLAYGLGAGTEFAECLRQQGRGDLFTETHWHLVAPWLVSETLPDRQRWNNLSDCGHGLQPAAVFSYTCGRLAELARRAPERAGGRLPPPESVTAATDFLSHFPDSPGPRRLSYPDLAALMGWVWEGGLGRRITSAGAPAQLAYLLFFEPCAAAADPSRLLPDLLHFRGRGLAVARDGYTPESLHLAVEAGPHAAGHDQSDKGSFTLYGYGGDLAIDSGYGNDGDPLKSGGGRAHNTVLINGQGQPLHWHNQSGARLSGLHHSPLLDWIRVDAREAWNVRYDSEWRPQPTAAPVEKATRHFLLIRGAGGRPPYLAVMDDLRKDGAPAAYTWLWHIPSSMRFAGAADRWTAAPLRLDGTLLTSAPGRAAGGARFTLTAPADGLFDLAGLVRAGGEEPGKSDSFWVTLDGRRRQEWHLGAGRRLAWSRFAPSLPELTNGIPLKAGQALRVDLHVREPEAQLARLALLPRAAPLPVAADAAPADGAASLPAGRATLLDPPLLARPIPAPDAPDARLTVFPVTTDPRLMTNLWFETSREGSHPLLEHTVRAVEPRFLMILVPGTSGTPLPRVRRIPCEQGVAAEIAWPDATDLVLFATGPAPLQAGGVATDSRAAFVRRARGAATDWALLDGTRLSLDGRDVQPAAPHPLATDSRRVQEAH